MFDQSFLGSSYFFLHPKNAWFGLVARLPSTKSIIRVAIRYVRVLVRACAAILKFTLECVYSACIPMRFTDRL